MMTWMRKVGAGDTLDVLNNVPININYQHHIGTVLPGWLSKGDWNRIGGMLSSNRHQLGAELEDWVDSELDKCGYDSGELLPRYTDTSLLVTRYTGHTHFFVAPYGPGPADCLQQEVEEQQELLDRKLINAEQPPRDRTSLACSLIDAKLMVNNLSPCRMAMHTLQGFT